MATRMLDAGFHLWAGARTKGAILIRKQMELSQEKSLLGILGGSILFSAFPRGWRGLVHPGTSFLPPAAEKRAMDFITP